MCPRTSKPSAGLPGEESKPDSWSSSNASLQLISATFESHTSPTASVKTINISPVTRVGSHCHADFVIGQHCMTGPSANINCVGYEWITRFDTPEWNYNLECGPVKTAGGCNRKVEARYLKISWHPCLFSSWSRWWPVALVYTGRKSSNFSFNCQDNPSWQFSPFTWVFSTSPVFLGKQQARASTSTFWWQTAVWSELDQPLSK